MSQACVEVGKGGAVHDSTVPAEAPLCRSVCTGSTCFWLESSFHVCAPLRGEMLLKQHNEELCQCSWFHSKSTSSVWWHFSPEKSTPSVALLAILRLTSALIPALTQHFELEFVKVEKTPLKQTTPINPAFRSSSASWTCWLMFSSCVMQLVLN